MSAALIGAERFLRLFVERQNFFGLGYFYDPERIERNVCVEKKIDQCNFPGLYAFKVIVLIFRQDNDMVTVGYKPPAVMLVNDFAVDRQGYSVPGSIFHIHTLTGRVLGGEHVCDLRDAKGACVDRFHDAKPRVSYRLIRLH